MVNIGREDLFKATPQFGGLKKSIVKAAT